MLFSTDNGGEYTSDAFAEYLQNKGIRDQTTAPYTFAKNGQSEHLHRTIMNHACAIQCNSNLPPNMWGEAVKAASYLKNHTPTRTLEDKTPFEMWYGECPDVSVCVKLDAKCGYIYLATTQKSTTDQWNAFCWDTLTAPRHIYVFTDQVAGSMLHKTSYLLNHKT